MGRQIIAGNSVGSRGLEDRVPVPGLLPEWRGPVPCAWSLEIVSRGVLKNVYCLLACSRAVALLFNAEMTKTGSGPV
jgi:hypothetical protein